MAAVTAPVRTDADWTVEGRRQLGHEILDLAPAAGDELGRDGFCYTGWYARLLGVDPYRQSTVLRPLLDRMARAGLLDKTGGATVCRGPCRRMSVNMVAWAEAVGVDPTHTHMEACYYRLAVDRHEAQELWAEHAQQHRRRRR